MFSDRSEAGRQLAALLQPRLGALRPLVLALPRGGVLIGAEIARELDCDLDVLLVKKLRAPGSPELALGAVCEDGNVFVNREVVNATDADEQYIESEIKERQAEIRLQAKLYRKVKAKVPVSGRVVILTDDGLATGATMIASVETTALSRPDRLVVAVPVGAPEALRTIQELKTVDEVVWVLSPAWFEGVGQFYRDFRQIEDTEVIKLLEEFA